MDDIFIIEGTTLKGIMSDNISHITIPNYVKTIENYTFAFCQFLESILIPNSVTKIGDNVLFTPIDLLKKIVVETGNPVYDSRNNCNAIIETATNTLIAGCVSTIIPNTVTIIGANAFSYRFLTSINIPNSVTTIGNGAFQECKGLTSVTIPNSLISIGDAAFSGCRRLTSIKIPNSVTNIGEDAFSHCIRLTSIICEITDVFDVDESVFKGCENVTLYVPKGLKDIYRTKKGWNVIKSIEEG